MHCTAPGGAIDGDNKISLAGPWLYKKDIEPAFPQIRNYQSYPATLFNAMINPLIPFGIKGLIWYQGEANDSEAYRYRELFPMLITDWRQRWHQGNLPFLYVQLANSGHNSIINHENSVAHLWQSFVKFNKN